MLDKYEANSIIRKIANQQWLKNEMIQDIFKNIEE